MSVIQELFLFFKKPCCSVSSWIIFLFLPFFRISQRLRVLGSLTVIMFVFIITAIIVKVPLEPLPFFCLTMVKIAIINCACSQVFLIVSNRDHRQYSLIDLTPLQDSSGDLFCFVLNSIWGCVTGKSLWNGWIAPGFIYYSDHERSGTRWKLCSLRHDLRHCKCVTSSFKSQKSLLSQKEMI